MISRRPNIECEAIVNAMIIAMKHEEFYASGFYNAPAMGIHTGWVALGSSFDARQIFFNEQKDIALIFSGECFADGEDLAQLKRRGHKVGQERADWLVHSYEEEGDRFFGKLNGLFSGVLIDRRKNCAFLFNDRYGVDRLYVHDTEDALYFASEAKALLRVLPQLRAFDEEGVAQFLAFGCTLEGRTLFRGIDLLPGGSVWRFESGTCRKERYFASANWEAQESLSVEDFESEFHDTFNQILPRYFESESGVGISLTGGLDTRMIMSSGSVTREKPVCYTFGAEKGETLDARLAARVAETCGLGHHILRIGVDFFENFAALADRTVYLTDGCFGVLGAHEIYLNRKARELAPVRLTGNFGSEVLRGMSTFKPIGLSRNLLSHEFRFRVCSAGGALSNSCEHPVTFAAFREIPWNLFGSLAAGRDRGYAGDDAPVISWLRRLLFRGSFKIDYLSNEGLPHWLSPLDPILKGLGSKGWIVGLHKYLHYRGWLRQELAAYVSDILIDLRNQPGRFWNSHFLKFMAEEHIRGHKNYQQEINAVLTLEAVERLLFRDLRRGPESSTVSRNRECALAN